MDLWKCTSKLCIETLLFANVIAFGSLVVRGLNGSKIRTINEYTLSVHDRREHQTPYGVMVCKQTSEEIKEMQNLLITIYNNINLS